MMGDVGKCIAVLGCVLGCGAARRTVFVDAGGGEDAPVACPDLDLDGHASSACGGDDCDDTDDAVHPGASEGPGEWTVETIDSTGLPVVSLAIDDAGVPAVAYARMGDQALLARATKDGEVWVASDEGIGRSEGASIGLSSGSPRAVWHMRFQESDQVVYAAAPQWRLMWAADGDRPALATDVDGTVHLCFRTEGLPGELAYATVEPRTRDLLGVVTSGKDWSEFSCAIAIDGAGLVRIAYASGTEGTVRLATRIAGDWSDERIDDVAGEHVSLALDPSRGVHVAYAGAASAGSRSVTYAAPGAGGWTRTDIASDARVDSTSIHASGEGDVQVAWAGAGVWFATNASGAWSVEEVDLDGSLAVSLALEPDGRAAVAFYRDGDGLLFARRTVPEDGVDRDCDGR
jgi:hypothetical protein